MMNALIFNIQKCSLHDGFGIRTTVFFKGCNLACKWCSNPESQLSEPQMLNGEMVGKHYTVKELVNEVIKDKPFYDMSDGGVTLSGGEPMLQHDFITKLCDALHDKKIHIAIETAACVSRDIFKKVISKCDLALIDLKHWDSDKHKAQVEMGNELVLSNIKYALKNLNTKMIIRIPIIPKFNDSIDDARNFGVMLSGLGIKHVHLLPFHQLAESKYDNLNIEYTYKDIPQLYEEDLEAFASILKQFNIDVQIGG